MGHHEFFSWHRPERSASLAVVAPGISEALIATAAGLAVAIPSVIAFNYFMHKIRIMSPKCRVFQRISSISLNGIDTGGGR
jgi:biopolymer transport protein ExbB/TolQ